MGSVLGRKKEVKRLDEIYHANKSIFLAVYGRRRVGKTYLIRTHFETKFSFYHTGLANVGKHTQLLNFYHTLQKSFGNKVPDKMPQTWLQAFQLLADLLEQSKKKRKVVFLDELPWMDTAKSGFLPAFEHFWNSWASARTDVVLIVCGSATSWIVGKVIRSKGGLHNRISEMMHIKPFSLTECEMFLKVKGIHWNRYQIVEAYMALGGIPHYWDLISKGVSATQAIDALFYGEDAVLGQEMDNLLPSLFRFPEHYESVLRVLTQKGIGLSREDIIKEAKLPNGGGISKVMEELEQCGFIRKYIPFGKKYRDSLYQLTDFYVMFYYKFISKKTTSKYSTGIDSPARRAWSGYAFEMVCLQHIDSIKSALGISGIDSSVAAWRSKENGKIQIDLIIDRRDGIINICEMKFSISEFVIDKSYDKILRDKVAVFQNESHSTKAIHLTFISTYGIKLNAYSGMVQQSLILEDLFE